MDTPPPKIARIAGQRPSVWPALQRNVDNRIRTEEEILDLLQANGIVIPDDVEFFIGEEGDFPPGTFDDLEQGHLVTAKFSGLRSNQWGYVYFHDMYNKKRGMLPIMVNPVILISDEAILAMAVHELHELLLFRELFAENNGKLQVDYFEAEGMPMNGNNFHSQAWAAADDFIRRRRGT